MKQVIRGLLLAGLLAPAAALADAMEIDPGRWTFKSVAVMPMSPEPVIEEQTDCVPESEIDPKSFLKEIEECAFSDVEASASSMSWTLTCPNPAGTLTGKGRFRSTGDTVMGEMKMSMSVDGAPMHMSIDWSGKRLGPCEE